MSRLLIVDDEQSICWGLSRLAAEMGHTAETAASAEEGLQAAAQNRPDAIILDVRLPGMDGLEAMRHFHDLLGPTPIIVITAHGDLNTAVEAVRNGAFDYLAKPFDLCVAQRAIERCLRTQSETVDIQETEEVETDRIVGKSPVIQEVFKRIALVASSEACVHIHGESGTGKELAARAIHRHSRRCQGPFVVVNLASLSETLAESELFGHIRGAFTGAEEMRKGLLEQADGGTVFLDEIADIPLSIQVKLLRSLEHGEIIPVGASRPIRSDFRVISATHQNLAELVAEGLFRHDLYYRLITFEIELPPLRDRREDIDLLVDHFLNLLAAKGARPRASISKEAADELRQRPWNGNVRELRNTIEHATVLERDGTITIDHFPPPAKALPPKRSPQTPTHVEDVESTLADLVRRWAENRLHSSPEDEHLYEELMAVIEPPLLRAAMQNYHNQCATAARRLGLHRTTLRKKLDQFGI